MLGNDLTVYTADGLEESLTVEPSEYYCEEPKVVSDASYVLNKAPADEPTVVGADGPPTVE